MMSVSGLLKLCPFCKPAKKDSFTLSFSGDDVECLICGTTVEREVWKNRPIEDALRAENERLIKLFESLTPGGSEFYNDPDRCYQFAKGSHSTMGKVAAERNTLRAEIEALLDEINSLGNIIIDSSTRGYVSSNDLDRANDAVDMWIEKKG